MRYLLNNLGIEDIFYRSIFIFIFNKYKICNLDFTTKFVSSDIVSCSWIGEKLRHPRGEQWGRRRFRGGSRETKMRCVWFSSTDKARLISRHGLLFPTAIAWLRSCILSPDSFIPFLPSFPLCDVFHVFIPVSHFILFKILRILFVRVFLVDLSNSVSSSGNSDNAISL